MKSHKTKKKVVGKPAKKNTEPYAKKLSDSLEKKENEFSSDEDIEKKRYDEHMLNESIEFTSDDDWEEDDNE